MRPDDVIASLGWDLRPVGAPLAGAASGAAVLRVRADSADAVLKLTRAGRGQPDARRELTFYRTLAGQLPIRTPRLLRHADDDRVTAILLSAHPPTPPAREWGRSAWLGLAEELAALHATPVPEHHAWLDTPWLQRILDRPPVDAARSYWSATVTARQLGAVLDAPAALAAAVAATGEGLLHGDCHVGNLLHGGDRLVWADWQVTGVGSRAVDLAFLCSRAHADGADLPYAAMHDTYAARGGLDGGLLRRSLIAAELGVLLFGWPGYATRRDPAARDRLTRRLITLIDHWRSWTP
ncbi:aminoglycoside phosphotransferase family protein [Micromonospora sp. NPDC050686]|uniref:aminoglycoside phosphotransferase family protein n=1 Tax=Micromonospora sp. NPDC050686 TaxID=3154631 RepID=UPI0033D9313B